MLKNCDNQFTFGQFREIKYTAANNSSPHRSNKKKTQDLLVNTSRATRHVARNFMRAGENNNRVLTFKHFYSYLLVKHHP